MTKHTPAPWNIEDVEDCQIIEDANGNTICTLYEDTEPEDSVTNWGWLKPLPNAEANARLIAAAPELLEALKWALDVMEIHKVGEGCGTQKAARAAILKAEG